MAALLHELWVESDQEQTFCLAGPMGADARARLMPDAKKVWTVLADSHFDAMTKYYRHIGRGLYTTEFPSDHEPYPDEWLRIQQTAAD